MADKKSAAARKKHVTPGRGDAKRGKPDRKAAPERRKLAKAVGKAEAPAAKVKRGEKEKAPKQAKKTAKGGDEEADSEDGPEGDEPEVEVAVADVGDNDALPSDIVSSDQIDDVMSMFGDNDIAIVDEANKVKLPETKPPEPEPVAAKEEDQTTPQEKAEQEEEDAYSKSNDPVRMYLRKMGSVSLLTREGEVEIAKRIEDGEKEVLDAVLHSSIAIKE